MADSRRTDTPAGECICSGPPAQDMGFDEHCPMHGRRTDTPDAVSGADGIKCRATFCFRPIVEAERDAARAALDRALTALRELADFAGEATGNAYCSVIAQHARDVLAELDPPKRHAD